MKVLVMTAIMFVFTQSAWAIRGAPDAEVQSFTYTILRLNPGYDYSSLLNQDGTRSVFAGPAVNGEFDIVFTFKELELGVAPFIHYNYANSKNTFNSGDRKQEFVRTEFMYGLKAYINPFYAGAAYGDLNSTISQYNNGHISNIGVSSKVLGFTGGVRLFGLYEDWSLWLTGWYKSSFFNKAQNPGLSGNTQMESLEIYFSFSLSPLFEIL